jgi:predicted ATP-dependent serine protease
VGRSARRRPTRPAPPAPARLSSVEPGATDRWSTGIRELDFVLGGGIVPGSLILLGGEPGIGKSTLLLQVAARLEAGGHATLYVSGEESAAQVRLRADRLGAGAGDVLFLGETDLDAILARADRGPAPPWWWTPSRPPTPMPWTARPAASPRSGNAPPGSSASPRSPGLPSSWWVT